VANKVVMIVHGAMLYGPRMKIKDNEVLVQATKSLINGYFLCKKVTLDFLEVENCRHAIEGIILWSIEFMHYA
jgi:hypothetical protein